ncbi:MAG TPA: sugar phosphate isomerase/epimerase [Candidatus Paceibacterota bacterium]|nr:sugar phosphate isomerase/epimerase [Verrucomicrobiota bacterium]HRY48115.1 sugar phosphate isomerase/epimerase [Candidatus Paceibacterota bacterium]HSA00175.1 sugar phosphate isomerase/epimerase [Candidatus Paceibacterota bacterium]
MKNWHLSLIVPVAALACGFHLQAQIAIPDDCKTGGFAIGCQAYTFNRFSAFEAIEKTAKAGGKVIEFYPGQKLSPQEPDLKVDHNASENVLAKLKAKLAEHGVKAVNYGVVGISRDEAEARKVFEFAKKMGMRAVTTESADAIDTLEKLAKEYNIAVGFHNHPGKMNNPDYKVWNPYYIAGLVEGRDQRLGAAADTGHWVRSNLNPVECLRILKGRLISAHLKDLHQMGEGAHDVPYGTGVSNVKAILDELKAQGFQGNISIEYEYNWDNSLPEVTQCIDFVREYGAK